MCCLPVTYNDVRHYCNPLRRHVSKAHAHVRHGPNDHQSSLIVILTAPDTTGGALKMFT